ncbi:hypothetical protein NX784_03935 [Massilia pinisoli]|uniref:Uncharacterized protein n=1 Tax=Massilia pinisoli TaxID=1772194 RepID=A0ABT1ZLE8_9BURK|nr:hypothetical protein [Massilia pinisoli]MCS0580735.1 hypothetical protein [Massilia pinisoli]
MLTFVKGYIRQTAAALHERIRMPYPLRSGLRPGRHKLYRNVPAINFWFDNGIVAPALPIRTPFKTGATMTRKHFAAGLLISALLTGCSGGGGGGGAADTPARSSATTYAFVRPKPGAH